VIQFFKMLQEDTYRVNYHALKDVACDYAKSRVTIGRLTLLPGGDVADHGLLATCSELRASIALSSAQFLAELMHQRAMHLSFAVLL
jgi:hypothetical protein